MSSDSGVMMEEEDLKFTINKEYAKKYEEKKQREELSKLQEKYPDGLDSESSSSEEEDENAEALTEEKEQDFLRTLSLLKARDPKIYDPNVRFFRDEDEEDSDSEKSKSSATGTASKAKPIYLHDYERLMLQEHGSQAFASGSDEDDDDEETKKRRNAANGDDKSYVQVLKDLKKEFEDGDDGEDDDDEWFTSRKKKTFDPQLENNYREWLRSDDTSHLRVEESAAKDLGPLKQFWNDPGLDENERFLRDYILNHGYVDREADVIPTYDELMAEDVGEDEDAVDNQEQFERKYNFRYEEPDAEFVKRYPRTTATSVRKADDSRKEKRKAVIERKKQEKEEREAELKRLKKLKRKEIQEKLSQIQDITGVGVDVDKIDLDGDFDPAKYDEAMKEAFSSDYYDVEESEKPIFSDLEDGSEEDVSDVDEVAAGCYGDYSVVEPSQGGGDEEEEPQQHAEGDYHGEGGEDEEEFNMDADYDPSAATKSKKQQKRDRRRRRHGVDAEDGTLPVYNPEEKTLQEYLDEYFKLDYEDKVGDTKCRFKYREVLPNSFGLSTEEILTCEDRELNSWVSLKKSVQYREKDEELADVRKYKKRAREGKRKRRILASAYKPVEEDEDKDEDMDKDTESTTPTPADDDSAAAEPPKKKKLKQKQYHAQRQKQQQQSRPSPANSSVADSRKQLFGIDPNRSKRQKKRKRKANGGSSTAGAGQ
eukprot:scpid54194/ scgid20825/ Protein KRI1 homolog